MRFKLQYKMQSLQDQTFSEDSLSLAEYPQSEKQFLIIMHQNLYELYQRNVHIVKDFSLSSKNVTPYTLFFSSYFLN